MTCLASCAVIMLTVQCFVLSACLQCNVLCCQHAYSAMLCVTLGTSLRLSTLHATVERRYNWLRKRLKSREEVWAIFPESWRVPQLLCLMFCQVCEAYLLQHIHCSKRQICWCTWQMYKQACRICRKTGSKLFRRRQRSCQVFCAAGLNTAL